MENTKSKVVIQCFINRLVGYLMFSSFCRFTSYQPLGVLQTFQDRCREHLRALICTAFVEAQIQRYKTPWKARSVFAWCCQTGICHGLQDAFSNGLPSTTTGCSHSCNLSSRLNPGSCWPQREFKWQNPWRTGLQELLSQATAVFRSVVLQGLSPHLFYFLWERH